jgi:predicted acylesterase/phospholipase RssA
VVVDRIAGTSMGAFVGAMAALGMDPEEMDAHCYDEWVRRRPLGDYTVPRHALIRGSRFEAMVKRVFGTAAIEELPRGFTCGAADLRTGEYVVRRTGPLWDAVGISMCLPILAPPQVRGDRVLIDGSFVDNLPVATMAAAGEGPIIAVDVKATFERPGTAGAPDYEGPGGTPPAPPAAADAAAQVPRVPRVPGLGETLMRVLLMGSADTADAARRHADLVIRPRPVGVGLLEFHQLDRAREAGRAAARAVLEDPPAILRGGR